MIESAVQTEMLFPKPDRQTLMKELAGYRKPVLKKTLWQLANTGIPYFILWGIMIYLLKSGFSFYTILPLVILASLLLVRIFILFHDCCHGALFPSAKANKIVGYITGILTFTSFYQWRHAHLLHHATAGNLDQRGMGDIWTLTVEEYHAASRLKRLAYRLYRNPLVLLGLGPIYSFLIVQRFAGKAAQKRERLSVIFTNLAILTIMVIAGFTIGIGTYFLIQLPIMFFAGLLGVWLFYVQHQYEGVYWARKDEYDSLKASLQGSSYYRLPKILQWFTGNIGLHHIHHVEPRIPNYRLQHCFNQVPLFQAVKPLTLRRSLASLRMNLWDERQQKLVSFRASKQSKF